MLYENYKKKIEKIAQKLKVLWKYRILIFSIILVTLLSNGCVMVSKGTVIDEVDCPTTIVYGDSLPYQAKALFSDIYYQYSTDSSFNECFEEMPRMPGRYYVRAFSYGSFNSIKYGDIYEFTITPRAVDVTIAEESLIYGDMPNVSASLFYGDTIECSNFTYSDFNITESEASVTISFLIEDVKVVNTQGEDVSSAYVLNAKKETVELQKREVTLTVASATKEYDGLDFQCAEYEITAGNLVGEDAITDVEFSSAIEAGEIENSILNLRVVSDAYSKERIDVTNLYDFTIVNGTLTIEKRAITVETDNNTWMYDGQPHKDENVTLSGSGLIEGHNASYTNAVEITNVSTVENSRVLTVLDANGNDVTGNYNISYVVGTLEIKPRPLHIVTDSGRFVYDGEEHSVSTWNYKEFTEDDESEHYELVEGHTSNSVDVLSFTNVKDTAEGNNVFTITIFSGEEEVTENYDIHYEYGMVEIYKRAVYIVTDSGRFVYDGKEHSVSTWNYKLFDEDDESENYKLVDAHTWVAENVLSFTNVKDTAEGNNVFTITIFSGEEELTENYDIHYEYGTVEVYKRAIYIVTDSGRFVYDGKEHSVSTWSYKLFDEDDESEHYELIEGHTSNSVDVLSFTNVKDTAEGNNVFTITIFSGEEEVTENYDIHYEYGMVEIYKRAVYIVTDSGRFVYDGEEHSVSTWSYKLFDEDDESEHYELIEGHTSNSVDVLSFTNVKDTAEGNNVFEIAIFSGEEEVTENYDIHYEYGTVEIYKRAVYIVTDSGEFVYDGEEHSVSTWSYKEFTEDDESENYKLVDTHTWVAENVLSFTNVKDTAEGNNVFTITIFSGEEEATENYDIHYEYGTVEIYKRAVYIVTDSSRFVYDGEEHSVSTWNYKEFTEDDESEHYELVDTHTWVAEKVLSFTNVKDTAEGNNVFTIAILNGEEDVTENYDVRYEYGTVEIYKRAVYIVTDSGRFVYDGEEHSVSTWHYKEFTEDDEIEHYELVNAHTWLAVDVLSFTNVKDTFEGNNVFTIAILNGEEELTENYDIHYEYGTVEIYKRAVYIVTDSGRFVYDGEEHSVTTWTYKELEEGVESYNLVEEHSYVAVDYPIVSKVSDGVVENKYTIIINDSDGEDVTENYDIHYEYGTIQIVQRAVYIVTDSEEFVYDGEEHSVSTWNYKEFTEDDEIEHYELVNAHTWVAVDVLSFTNIEDTFEGNNVFTITIFSGEEEVTENYDIHYEYGTVEISRAQLYILTDSAIFVYDGEEHFANTWTYQELEEGIKSHHLAEGHSYVAVDYPIVSKVSDGVVENKYTIIINDSDGEDVTENYDIYYKYGTIQIVQRAVYIVTDSGRFVYDGEKHSVSTWNYKEFAEDDEIERYELVDTHTWVAENVLSFTNVKDTAEGNNVFTITIFSGEEEVTENYDIHYEYGTVEIYKRAVYIVTDSGRFVYDGEEHSVSTWSYKLFEEDDESEHYELIEGHTSNSVDVLSFTNVKDTAEGNNVFTIAILNGEEEVTENYAIHYEYGTVEIYKRDIYIRTGSYETVYDDEIYSCAVWEYVGEIDNETRFALIQGHTWEAINVPTFQYVTNEKNNNIFSIIIFNGEEDVTENYGIHYEYGTISILKRVIYIVTATESWMFDDEEHFNSTWTYHDETPYRILGENPDEKVHSYEVVYFPTVHFVTDGKVNNELVILIFDRPIEDESKKDVTKNYDIQIKEMGTISIDARPITVVTATNRWEYDGEEHFDKGYSIVSDIKPVEGHELLVTEYSVIKEVGSIENQLSFKVMSGEQDMSANYALTIHKGRLTVTWHLIEIMPNYVAKEYDGKELLPNGFQIVYGTLESNHHIVMDEVIIIGSQTEIGDSESKIQEGSVRIVDEDGNDVTDDYEIVLLSGTLSVTKISVCVTAGSASKRYDGTPLTCAEYTYSDKLLAGHVLYAQTSGSQTEVGTSKNVIIPESVKVLDQEGNDVTDIYYNVTFEDGTLTVECAATIKVITGSAKKEFDGTPLTCDESSYVVVEGAIFSGDYVKLTVTGSQTEIGVSDNTVIVEIFDEYGNPVDSRYELEFELGKLEVLKRKIIITTGGDFKVYDGEPLTCDKYYIVNLLKGHNGTLVINGSQTEIGKSPNTVIEESVKIFDENGQNVTNTLYEISYDLGWLCVYSEDGDLGEEEGGSGGGAGEGESGGGSGGGAGEGEGESGGGAGEEEGGFGGGAGEGEGESGGGSGGGTGEGEGGSGGGSGGGNGEGEGGSGGGSGGGTGEGEGGSSGGSGGGTGEGEGGSGGGSGGGTGEGEGGSGGGSGGGTGGNLDQSGDINGEERPAGSDYVPGEPNVVLEVKSTTTGTIYMRLMSYGDYTGTGWGAASEYERYIIENYGFNYLVAHALQLAGVAEEHKLEVKSYTSDYLLPYFLSMTQGDYVIQSNDVKFSGAHNGNYTVYYYTYNKNLTDLQVDLGTLSEVERLYREFVYNQYCVIDEETNTFIQGIIKEQGWSKKDPSIIYKVQQYVQNCASYSLMYDPNLDRESNIVIAFLSDDYNEGLCRHYASAATMIYRALGIPARYTIGYVGSTVKDQWTAIKSNSGHAWTEVYIDGIGWVPVEVTGSMGDNGFGGDFGGGSDGGDLGDDELELDKLPQEIEIAPLDVTKVYDGEPLYARNELKIPYNSAIEILISKGFTYEVQVSGSRTEIGVSESIILSFKLFAPNGEDVTEQFEITYLTGKVRITKQQVIIVLYDIQKTYDGKPISYNANDYWIKQIPDGYTLEFALKGSITNTGEFDVEKLYELPYVIRNEVGEDVTDQYYLQIEGRGLRVNRRYIEITSESVKREYNGEALTDDTIIVTFGSIIKGHTLTCKVTGSITDIGYTDNTIEGYVIVDENGKDVTKCYEVKAIEGILEVVKGSAI